MNLRATARFCFPLLLLACGSEDASGAAGGDGTLGQSGPPGAAGPVGATGSGAAGAPGADGAFAVYGNGSAGAKTVAAELTLNEANTQYTDFTVNVGTTLYVPSGTTIRATGTFTNKGAIIAYGGATGWVLPGGEWFLDNGMAATGAWAGSGTVGNATATRSGNAGGRGRTDYGAMFLLSPPLKAGGAGGNGYLCSYPNVGGGSVRIVAKGAFTNGGAIRADGGASGCGNGSGNGGGGGGMIILASQTSIVSTGAISASGGEGQPSDGHNGPGGGGGGGLIHLLAPTVTEGTLTPAGGVAGAVGATITAGSDRSGGSGGGGSIGHGGRGGDVQTTGVPSAAEAGQVGVSYVTRTDPTSLLL